MVSKTDQISFTKQLADYRARIEPRLKQIAKELQSSTYEQFGSYPTEAVSVYNDVLLRGGKRIRGSLAICAYELFGGTDKELIDQAAAGLEMLNTYILVADDIQDRSELRRGGLTAHAQLRAYHQKQRLKGEAEHFGQSIAINAMLIGMHAAMNLFANLPTSSDKRLQVIEHINNSFITTAHGQTLDIFNEVVAQASQEDINNVLIWKTAQYTLVNPLQLGALLAGANSKDLQVLADVGSHAGKLFQITDDIIGIYGDEAINGKSPLDDIKEGKRTLLTTSTLALATKTDAYFLEQMLGNQKITQADFKKCQDIIRSCGALVQTQKYANQQAIQATQLINKHKGWPQEQVRFLTELINFLLQRARL